MAPEFTQLLAEMSTRRYFWRCFWGKAGLVSKADSLTAKDELIVEAVWNPQHLTTL
jgi:hypothetical protein